MTTAAEALTGIKSIAAGFTAIPIRWANEDNGPVPDEPTPFVFARFVIDDEKIAGYGGGRGANLWRCYGYVEFVVLTLLDSGMEDGLAYAEDLADLYRGTRLASPVISFWEATVSPGERDPDNGNYWKTISAVSFSFEKTA